MALPLQFNVYLHAEAAKVICKGYFLFARNICRLFQLIFDSDHNFHDHRIGFNPLLKYIHAIQRFELVTPGFCSSQSCKREKEKEIRTPTNEVVKEQWK